MLRISRLPLMAALLIATSSAAFAQSLDIGDVTTINGGSLYGSESGRNLMVGDDVYMQEILRTDDKTSAEIVFNDNTNLKISESSEIELTELYYNPADPSDGSMAVNMAKGVFRFSSGKLKKDKYTLSTPVSSIGIRGTEFTVIVDGDSGETFIIHHSGIVDVSNLNGQTSSVSTPGYAVRVPPVIGGQQGAPTEPQPYRDVVPAEYLGLIQEASLGFGTGPITIMQADGSGTLNDRRTTSDDPNSDVSGSGTQTSTATTDIRQVTTNTYDDINTDFITETDRTNGNSIRIVRSKDSQYTRAINGTGNTVDITMMPSTYGSTTITGNQNNVDITALSGSAFGTTQIGNQNSIVIGDNGGATLLPDGNGVASTVTQTGNSNIFTLDNNFRGHANINQIGDGNSINIGVTANQLSIIQEY